MLAFFTNLSLMEFQVRYLTLFLHLSVIHGFGCFWMVSLHKNIQLMLEFHKGPFLALHFSCYTLIPYTFLLYINGLPGDVMCNIAIYAHGTTLYAKCDQACDL